MLGFCWAILDFVGREVKTASTLQHDPEKWTPVFGKDHASAARAGRRSTRHAMVDKPFSRVVLAAAAILAVAAACGPVAAQANHKCDPVDPVSDPGWSVVPSLETIGRVDGAPYQTETGGDWFIDRTTTLLPFCNYYNEIGIYSMRSYTLAPQVAKERIGICRGNVAVPPYAGSCPPIRNQ
jgi:hypothetical protein